jgi:hypothetical protein
MSKTGKSVPTRINPTSFFLTPGFRKPLIDIPFEENGQEVVRYFSEETQADKAVSNNQKRGSSSK